EALEQAFGPAGQQVPDEQVSYERAPAQDAVAMRESQENGEQEAFVPNTTPEPKQGAGGAAASLFLGIPGLIFIILGWRRVRGLAKIAVCPLSAIKPGTVKVIGQVKAHGLMADPIWRQPCVFYDITVEENKDGRKWRTHRHLSNPEAAFILEDGTGKALVYPSKADLRIEPEFYFSKWNLEGAGSAAVNVRAFLAETGVDFNGVTDLRVTGIVAREPGQLCVIGTAQNSPEGICFKKVARRSYVITKSNDGLSRQRDRGWVYVVGGLALWAAALEMLRHSLAG
ncbi:MAG: hypothetical protein AABZ44_04185, partial [Elusimicrobiota bacterium]